jgi:hypothetical protein
LAQSQFPPSADRASYVLFDVPKAVSTKVVGINNSGEVTGYFQDSPSGAARGFVRGPNGKITVFDASGGASETMPAAINDPGDVAGFFFDAAGIHSFLRNAHGKITVFDVPQLSSATPPIGFAMTLDNRGDIAGFIIPCPGCDTWVGFVRDQQGDITTFAPIVHGSVPTGINERGDITGVTSPFYSSQEGFVRDRDGTMTVFDAGGTGPGPKAHPVGINNRGNIAGYYYDSQSGTTRGFERDSKGTISVFDAGASALGTQPAGINDSGEIVGDFSDVTGGHNFLRDSKGNITVFDVPNTSGVHAVSVNNRGDIAGYFLDATTGQTRGFVRIANP